MTPSLFLYAVTVAFLFISPVMAWAIFYDMGRTAPWHPALKWGLMLFVVFAFSGTIGYAQMVGNPNWCSSIDGFWYYAGGCFLPGM